LIDKIKIEAKSLMPWLEETRRHLHSHPELSFEEFNTSAYIQDQLEKLEVPFEVMCGTGVVGMIKGEAEGKTIALRADIDALPITELNEVDYKSQSAGVMHACGHDVHTTSLLGTAAILMRLKSQMKGSVKLIFQLGEEKLPGGASMMIEAGVLQNAIPDSIVGQHVYPELEAGKVGFRSGKYMASADEIHLTVIGKGGHAALPDRNIDPVLIASHIIVALQQVVSRRVHPGLPCVLSFGKVEANGATNVIPDQVKIAGTFRTFDEEWRSKAHGIITDIAQNTATAMGGECEVNIGVGYPFVDNDQVTTELAQNAAIEFVGQENVVDLEMRMTAEDFAFYSQQIPGTFYRLGTRESSASSIRGLHTPTFDVDERCLETGAGLMAYIALKQLEA
jgi:amidohydrolase